MTDAAEFFHEIVASLTDEDQYKVGSILESYIGEDNPITLKNLCIRAYGAFNEITERKTRRVLEDLVNIHKLPVGALSGKSGRWLCKDDEEKQRVISDLESRHSSLGDRIRNIRMARTPPKAIEPGRAYQRNLWQ